MTPWARAPSPVRIDASAPDAEPELARFASNVTPDLASDSSSGIAVAPPYGAITRGATSPSTTITAALARGIDDGAGSSGAAGVITRGSPKATRTPLADRTATSSMAPSVPRDPLAAPASALSSGRSNAFHGA